MQKFRIIILLCLASLLSQRCGRIALMLKGVDWLVDYENTYYENGETKSTWVYYRFLSEGYYYEYYPDGTLMNEGTISIGKNNDPWIWYDKNGIKTKVAFYKNGKVNGLVIDFFENGKVKTEGEFYNDIQHGLTKQYFPDGTPEIRCNYFNGILHGKFEQYYQNGNLLMSALINKDTTKYYTEFDTIGNATKEYVSSCSMFTDQIVLSKFEYLFKSNRDYIIPNEVDTIKIHYNEVPFSCIQLIISPGSIYPVLKHIDEFAFKVNATSRYAIVTFQAVNDSGYGIIIQKDTIEVKITSKI